jgi:hypothetical protein
MLTITEPSPDHDLAGLSVSEITNFIRDNKARLEEIEISTEQWVIIDQTGLDNSTGIIVERQYDDDNDDEEEPNYDVKAARLPLDQLWGMYGNLDIANMDFDEYVDEDAGIQEDGTYKWIGPFPSSNEEADSQTKKEIKLK